MMTLLEFNIAKLISMGIDVHFAGTRQAAVELYHDLVLQWCRTCYKQILNIESGEINE